MLQRRRGNLLFQTSGRFVNLAKMVRGNWAATKKQNYELRGNEGRKKIQKENESLFSQLKSNVKYVNVETSRVTWHHCLWPSWAGEHARRGQPDSGSGQLEVRHHEPGEWTPAERPPVGSPRLRQVPAAPGLRGVAIFSGSLLCYSYPSLIPLMWYSFPV